MMVVHPSIMTADFGDVPRKVDAGDVGKFVIAVKN
jgi:hypothetical protein